MRNSTTSKGIGLMCLILLFTFADVRGQTVGIKTNLLGWTLPIMNIGVEAGITNKTTIEVMGYYSPFTLKNHKTRNLAGVQAEYRYWLDYKFSGFFTGVHAHVASYDWAWKVYRYKGILYGGGLSCGYALMLTSRWNVEGTVGVGYTRINANGNHKYNRYDEREVFHQADKNYVGITKAGINVTYLF
ncbi:MAG: DUF3575 domain-containing protein [Marinifilaceae bacterium]